MLTTIFSYAIPVLSIVITYILGRLQSVQSDKKEAYKEAYESFYLPFISLLYKTQIWDVGFARLSLKNRHMIFNLITDNIKYMDKAILEYVDILYSHYSAILGKEVLEINSLLTHDKADEIFNEFTLRVLSRATWLAKKIHQPQIGEFVLELYCEETEFREKQRAELPQYGDHS